MQCDYDNIRVIDSMPIPVCEFRRDHFSKCFKGEVSYGRCSSKKQTYFGFKFHALTTIDGFLTNYVITPANIDDRNAVWDLCEKYNSISIIGDKGYVNKRLTPELKLKKDINLLFLKRGNSKENYPKEIRQLIFKVRRRIETSFSQLTEQLNLNKVKSKSMLGFITRTSIKVLAHNISFLMIDCQYKCNTLCLCFSKNLCRCSISKTLARSIIYYIYYNIKLILSYSRKIKSFRIKLS